MKAMQRFLTLLRNCLFISTAVISLACISNFANADEQNPVQIPLSTPSPNPPQESSQIPTPKSAPNKVGYIGALAGAGFASSDGNNATDFLFGMQAGYDMAASSGATFTMGLTYVRIARSESVDGTTVAGTDNIVTLDLLTRHLNHSPVYLGGRFGLDFVGVSVGGLNANCSSFIGGPVFGADFDLSDQVSVGLDLSYLVVAKNTLNFSSGSQSMSISVGSVEVFSTLLSLKLKF